MKSSVLAKRASPSFISKLTVSIVLGLAAVAHPATNVVTSLADSGSGSLRQAIADAAPADTIGFSVTGTITLMSGELWISKSLSIIGPGASTLTVSGHRTSRIFTIGTNSNVRISGLTLRDGRAANGLSAQYPQSWSSGPGQPGGAITNAGDLVLRNCSLLNNVAGNGGNGEPAGAGGPGGGGGAVYSVGTLSVSNCYFSGNKAGNGGPPGSSAESVTPGGPGGSGGAIYNIGTICLDGSIFTNNSSGSARYTIYGTELSGSYAGSGGAIYSTGILTASSSAFSGNSTGWGGHGTSHNDAGWSGGSGGDGGAVCGLGKLLLSSCSVSNNACGGGGDGGDVYWPTSPAYGGGGGRGGCGGGIYATNNLILVGCTVSGNRTGPGADGGSGKPPGGDGPGGSGGGVYSDGFLWLTNCTVTGNSCASGGTNTYWAGLGGSGGALYCAYGNSTVAVVSCTVVRNVVGTNGLGEGVYLPSYWSGPRPGGFLDNIIAGGFSRTQDVWGIFNSLGHNLIGATNASSGFTAAGDLVGSAAAPLDPLLGPLADNGGPTLTMALVPGSPAIDAGSPVGAPPTDQRGVARPRQGPVDIGAFQSSFDIPEIYVSRFDSSGFQLLGAGKPTQTCRLLGSTNFSNWIPIATNQFGPDGTLLFQDNWSSNSSSRFYRLVTP